MENKNIVVWSKKDCPLCSKAKQLLFIRDIIYKEKVIGEDVTREDLLEVAPHARTVPQIFIDDILIGGYTDLVEYINSQ